MNSNARFYTGRKAIMAALALVAAHGAALATPGSDAVLAITSAQSDSLLVVAALTAMGIALWAALYIKRKFFP